MQQITTNEYVHFYARRKAEVQGWTVTSRQLDYFLRVEGPTGSEPIDHLDVRGAPTRRQTN